MKTPYLAAVLLSSIAAWAQTTVTGSQTTPPPPTAYNVIANDANSRVWERTIYEPGPNGTVVPKKHRVTELATGMYYQTNGQWVESQDLIETYPQGAIARHGPYQVIFANNLNSAGAIDQQTPDGKRLRSSILGLAYDDRSTGKNVLIAQIQDSQGELISSNQVLYTNAFDGVVKADVRYTYKKGSFEQDVILRQQPPAPESFGLNSQSTEIEVLTEFIDPPSPSIVEDQVKPNALLDEEIGWGTMIIGHGRAFDLGEPRNSHPWVAVRRQYVTAQGRNILVEGVPIQAIKASLANLPLQASAATKFPMLASQTLALPKTPLANAEAKPMKLALASSPDKGFVLDYMELNTDTNDFTFQSGETYFISSGVSISGTTTFEGGTVLKFPEDGSSSLYCPNVVCDTTAYSNAVFTSQNDDGWGQTITNSTGSPAEGEGNYILTEHGLNHCQFYYAGTAIVTYSSAVFNDIQVGQCYWGLVPCSDVTVNNASVSGCNIFCDGGMLCECASFDSCFAAADGNTTFYNCAFFNMANVVYDFYDNGATAYGSNNGFYSCDSSLYFGANVVTGSGVDMGNTTADLLGLYWWTTPGGPAIEGDSIVDLGYHTPGVDAYGNPISTLVSGVPDYLSDANGDGLPDAWEMTWFGNLNHSASELDPGGNTLLYDYQNGIDPIYSSMVVAWGEDYFDQCDPPLGITNAVMLAGGAGYTIALLNNGTVIGWGNRTTEGMVPNSVTNVAMIASGFDHKVVMLTNGLVEAWGDDLFGECDVPANLTNATAISAQYLHTVALRSDKTVVSWGDIYSDSVENDVPSGLTNVTAIAAGGEFNLAVSNGTVVAWGDDDYGQCDVPAGLTNVLDVKAGFAHSVALKQDGTVEVWGDNTFGETNVPSGLSNVVAIAAGGYYDAYPYEPYSGYVMALKKDGTVVTWGANKIAAPVGGLNNVIAIGGEYDSGLAIRNGPPTPVITLEPTDEYQVAGGNVTFTARGAGLYGVTYQWQTNGVNIVGATDAALTLANVQTAQVGNSYDVVVTDNAGMGSIVSSNVNLHLVTPPVIISQTPLPTNQVVTYQSNLVLNVLATAPGTNNGFPLSYQWQFNGTNIAGATAASYTIHATATSFGTYSVLVSNAVGSTNAAWQVNVVYPGAVIPWGSNPNGELNAPFQITNVISLAAGKAHGVVALDSGLVTNWGSYWTGTSFVSVIAPPPITNAIAVAAGSRHDLALKSDGTVVAWGLDDFGQTNVPAIATNVIAIAAGGQESLALLQNGTVVQWGQTNGPIPTGLTSVTAIAAGTNFSLALLQNSTVVAWGANNYNQTNIPAGLSNVVAIAAGGAHALALKQNGTVIAWGAWTSVPVGLSNVMNIAAGENHSMALKNDGTVVAWGDDTFGQTNVAIGLNGVKLIAGGGDFSLAVQFSPTVMYPVDVSKDLLLIYNSTSSDSSNLCAYYLAHRPLVGGANVLGIECTTNETIGSLDFTNYILSTYLNWLTNNPTKRPQYLILFQDIPSRVEDTSPYPSVQYQLYSETPNRQPFVTSINMNGNGGIYDCKAYINKLETNGVLISSNSPVLSASAGAYGNTNYVVDDVNNGYCGDTFVSATTNGLIVAGVSPAAIDFITGCETATSFLPHITNAVNVAGYICWGWHSNWGTNLLDGYYPTNGDVQWSGNSGWWLIRTEESQNGIRNGQFLLWFSSNAFGGSSYSNTPVAGVTYVEEPGAGATDNAIYFGLWASGHNFAICAWNSNAITGYTKAWQMVGDPFVVR